MLQKLENYAPLCFTILTTFTISILQRLNLTRDSVFVTKNLVVVNFPTNQIQGSNSQHVQYFIYEHLSRFHVRVHLGLRSFLLSSLL